MTRFWIPLLIALIILSIGCAHKGSGVIISRSEKADTPTTPTAENEAPVTTAPVKQNYSSHYTPITVPEPNTSYEESENNRGSSGRGSSSTTTQTNNTSDDEEQPEEDTYPTPGCAQQTSFVTNLNVLQTPNLAEPAAGESYTDPVFGTCVVRITDRNRYISADDDSKGMKNEYSRVQSFNADESNILLRGLSATWYLYDAQTLKKIKELNFQGSVDPRWDSSDPETLFYNDGTRFYSYNTGSDESTQLHDFSTDFPDKDLASVSTRYEGSPAKDTRYLGFMAQDQEYNTVGFVMYDSKTDTVTAKREFDSIDLDSVTISPLGDYFLAYFNNYCERGMPGSDSEPCGLMVYDKNLQNGRSLLRIVGHSDTALDVNGDEVLVYQDIDTDHISMLSLDTGKITDLAEIDFSHTPLGFHISGRSLNRPGWAVISAYNGGNPTDQTWMDDQVFAMELKENGKIVRLAHHHSLYDDNQEHDYWAEPQASTNRDLTRILFTSNWGRTGTEEVDTYMVELPSDWTSKLN